MYSRALEVGAMDGGGLAPRTVAQVHVVLKQALAQARVWRAVASNVADLVKPPKTARREMKVLDTDHTNYR
jgi:hypothetical protein